jgi:hypothetical protein
MAQLKKFMFDNFVIETRPEADEPEPPVDEETAAEPVSPTEQEENVSAESPAETAAEPELEAEPEPEVEPEPEEEEFIPEPLPPAEKSYTQTGFLIIGYRDMTALLDGNFARRPDLAFQCSDNQQFHNLSLFGGIFNNFRHGNAQLVINDNHLAAGNQIVVDINVYRLADFAVEFDNRPFVQLQQLTDLHLAFAENGRNLNRNIINGFQVAGRTGDIEIIHTDIFFKNRLVIKHGAFAQFI